MLADLTRPDLPVIIQGATGRIGRRHTEMMRACGTNVVAGVSTSDPGETSVPIYRTMAEAVRATGATCTVTLVPPLNAIDAVMEALDAGVRLIVTPTEGMPVHDAVRAAQRAKQLGASWIGPSTPGVVVPGRMKLGFIPDASVAPGRIAVASKSGTLSYECGYRLKQMGLGQSIWIGVGGDPVKGVRFSHAAELFQSDPNTDAILILGEIGGTEEEDLAATIRSGAVTKPVYAILAGSTAPDGVTMGHAGALINGTTGTIASKREALESAGCNVFGDISEALNAIARGSREQRS